MRIRNAALAGATALAVAFGGSTVATAATFDGSNTTEAVEDAKGGQPYDKPEGSLSSKVGGWFNVDENDNIGTEADGRAIFGSSKSEHCDEGEAGECTTIGDQPTWAKTFYGVGVASAVASIAGLIGVVYNFFVHGPSF
ncbi:MULTISPECIES: hypothetical protein [Corynebacterium]|uniref:Uncharacterized protein n=3 Tax=Corynebacterium TaxID=1716 RepID=A0ACC4UB98_9CORY|nr:MULTISPECIES: hypothetical protein [Corynebacterium]KKO80315.1 hypothetical protein WU87_06010 [Corynebacterium minutissimum]OFN38634.1 hypothetical protein HMPREF2565_03165 [Corynebacterium sp. HMSC072A04]OFO23402.1 hypothetical protein HMPREF3056_03960 [Corynebacterium sp. HMSC056F09]OFO93791.1 hypothetical protein HMPREF3009_11230 [Corynebacterium sp. HMSC034H07]TRX64129.1 hypothetical protein FNY97_02070 [Corynebacterium aurimucosum]